MSQKEYLHTGRCIWCHRTKPDATFFTAPHIVPQSLGANEIGFDVCDECNRFFGSSYKGLPNIDLVFKEVFNASQKSLGERSSTPTKYSSAYFFYNRTTDQIKLKRTLSVSTFTKQFKRGLYEVFLQKYHQTFPDDNLDMFEAVRKFARYGDGNLNVYFIHNKIISHPTNEIASITLHMSEYAKKEIFDTGYYTFMCAGQILFLEILPLTASMGGIRELQKVAEPSIIHLDGTEKIYRLDDIRQFDFFYNRLAKKNINTDNLLRR